MKAVIIEKKKEEDLTKHLIYRNISRFITPFLYWSRVHPDLISLLQLGLAAVTTAAISISPVFVFLIVQAMLVCDCVDGELARLYKRKGTSGVWVDATVNFFSLILVMSSAAMYLPEQSKLLVSILGLSLFSFYLSEMKKFYMKQKHREVVLSKHFHFGGTSFWCVISLIFILPLSIVNYYILFLLGAMALYTTFTFFKHFSIIAPDDDLTN